jgi:hypothetical protein
VLRLGKGEVLPDLQRREAVFAELGTGFELSPSLALKAELHAHTPFYRDTELRSLGTYSLQFVFGGVWRTAPQAALEFGIEEDIKVDSAPDVGFVIGYRHAI